MIEAPVADGFVFQHQLILPVVAQCRMAHLEDKAGGMAGHEHAVGLFEVHQQAVAEFQKILDHPGLMMGDPAGARARLEKGRSLARAGDAAAARTAYEDFLALWKNADLDVPILAQAKADYAKLQ